MTRIQLDLRVTVQAAAALRLTESRSNPPAARADRPTRKVARPAADQLDSLSLRHWPQLDANV